MSKETTRSAFPVNNTVNHRHNLLTNTNHQFYHLYITIFLIGVKFITRSYLASLQNMNMVNYLVRFKLNETYFKNLYLETSLYNSYQCHAKFKSLRSRSI